MGMRRKQINKREKKKVFKCCPKKSNKKTGKSLIDRIIDKIPFELHVPTYQYCGPGTHLKKRLERGDPGINPLDAACKVHDIAYNDKDSNERSKADKVLQKAAFKRVFARDSSIGERAVALGVSAAMKIKRKLSGKGLARKRKSRSRRSRRSVNKNKPVSFGFLVKNAKLAIKQTRPDNIKSAIRTAITSVRKNKRGRKVREPRIIKLPSFKGGFLPLVPIFAGLGALGSIIGSTAGVVNAINRTRQGQMEMEESKRHNRSMESIAIGNKSGRGFYLHTNRRGQGYFLSSYPKNR